MAKSTENELPELIPRRIVALGAGKGGIGTSMIATNLAVFLAQIGKRVVLIDANPLNAGLHAWLGMDRPTRTISDPLLRRVNRIEDALVETKVTGLSLLGGSADLLGGIDIQSNNYEWLVDQVKNLESDFVLIDLASGLHPLALDLFSEADVSLAVTMAMPDAVEATYRYLVAAFIHKLKKNDSLKDSSLSLLNNMAIRPGSSVSAREIIAGLDDIEPGLAEEARTLISSYHPQLIVNQTRIKIDEGLGEAMVSAAKRWIGIVPRLLGTIEWDDNVWLSGRRGIPLLIDFPQSRACRGLERIVRRLLSQDFQELLEPTAPPPPTERQNLYELLEIYPGASEEEIRRAFKWIRDHFASDDLAVRGACSVDVCKEYQLQAEDAHATLIDKSRRREYDRAAFPDGFPMQFERVYRNRTGTRDRVRRTHDSLPKVELRDDQMVDGRFLAEIRRERGIDLVDISNRAKVSKAYLMAIEEERFADLPEPVYVRGFVTEFARYLKVDPQRAAREFMIKYDAYREKHSK